VGGMAHPGAVVRVGATVRRPASPHSASIVALHEHLIDAGFDGVAEPLGLDARGRETWSYIEGDVPIPPFPAWSMTDGALASVAWLLRRYHEAAEGFDPAPYAWSDEMADPRGGTLVVHADVCPENVVFRDGKATALLDFDFAAPGRAEWDVVATAGMWAPRYGRETRAPGMEDLDSIGRTRVFVDAYGLDADGRAAFVETCRERLGTGFLQRRVAAGEPQFVAMWEAQGGAKADARRHAWLNANEDGLRDALGLEERA
jgi:Phosphotransferase enzyme family